MNAPALDRLAELEARVAELEVRFAPRQIGKRIALRRAQFDHLVATVSSEFGVSAAAILGETRVREVVLARQAVMTIARRRLNLSYQTIGRALQRDHSSVMHGVRAMAQREKASPMLAARIEAAASLFPTTHQQESA